MINEFFHFGFVCETVQGMNSFFNDVRREPLHTKCACVHFTEQRRPSALLTHFPRHICSSLRPGASGKQFLHLFWQRVPAAANNHRQPNNLPVHARSANRLRVRWQSQVGIIAIRHNSALRQLRPGE